MRLLQIALLVLGLAGCALLLREVGVAPLAEAVARLSWWLPVVVLGPGLAIAVCETLSWRYAFRCDRVGLGRLLLARLAGEAFNHTTPTLNVGGDAVKAVLLRKLVPLRDSLPSLVVCKASDTLSQVAFLALATPAAFALADEEWLPRTMLAVVVLEAIGVGGFLYVQTAGIVARGGNLLARLGILGSGGSRVIALRIDRSLARYYRRQRGRFALSTGWFFAAWICTVVETHLVLALLGVEAGVAVSLVLTAAVGAASFLSFLVPGDVGVQEGAFVVVATSLGLGAEVGLALALVRRLRELSWVGIGYLCWLALSGSPGRSPATAAAAAVSALEDDHSATSARSRAG